MKLNICMLLPLSYEPNMRVMPQIGIGSYLTNFGHDVTWVIFPGKDHRAQSFSFNDVHVYVAPRLKYLHGSSIWVKILRKIPNTLKRMGFILKIIKTGKYNVIFVREDVFDGLIATYIKKRHKILFVFELVNPLEQEWESYKIKPKKPRFLYYLIARFNALAVVYIMKRADLVLPTTRWFEEGLTRKGVLKSKLMPYPNGVDTSSFLNRDGKAIREKYHLSNSKVVIYIGTLARHRCLDVLIKAFSKVTKEKGDTKLLMVGEGSARENLERQVLELGIRDEVIFTGQVPQPDVPNFIAAADIGVSPVPPFSFYKVSSPIKALEYMAMAKPVVATEEVMEHKEVINQSGGGVLVPFASEAFTAAIINLLDNPERAAGMGRKGQEWVKKNRSYEVLARRLEKRYFELLSNLQ